MQELCICNIKLHELHPKKATHIIDLVGRLILYIKQRDHTQNPVCVSRNFYLRCTICPSQGDHL